MNTRGKPLTFHWSLSQVGDTLRRTRATARMQGLPSLETQTTFCRRAEHLGIDSVLMATGFTRPDPFLLSTVLAGETETLKFMAAVRPGLMSPTLLVQQVNTFSQVAGDRLYLNLVSGHTPAELGYYGDFLPHDARYDRADEFLAICHAFWDGPAPVNFKGRFYRIEAGKLNTPYRDGHAPAIYVGGNSKKARDLACRRANCLWRFPDKPEALEPHARALHLAGTELGLLVSLIVRPTREEAHAAAAELISPFDEQTRTVHHRFASKLDSEGLREMYRRAGEQGSTWLTPCLWTGAVPFLGAPAIALLGSADDIIEAILAYKRAGVSQFLFMGWPDLEEMTYFGETVLPLLRTREAAAPGTRE